MAQRICWNRFLRGEESSIKCCFPARLWSSLGVAGLHPAGGVWGTAGRAPGHLWYHQLLPAPSTAGMLLGPHELDCSLITPWCRKPAIRESFLWAVSASYNWATCPPRISSSRAPCWGAERGLGRGTRGRKPGPHPAGSAHPRPDLEAVSRPCEAGPLSPGAVSPHPLVPALG